MPRRDDQRKAPAEAGSLLAPFHGSIDDRAVHPIAPPDPRQPGGDGAARHVRLQLVAPRQISDEGNEAIFASEEDLDCFGVERIRGIPHEVYRASDLCPRQDALSRGSVIVGEALADDFVEEGAVHATPAFAGPFFVRIFAPSQRLNDLCFDAFGEDQSLYLNGGACGSRWLGTFNWRYSIDRSPRLRRLSATSSQATYEIELLLDRLADKRGIGHKVIAKAGAGYVDDMLGDVFFELEEELERERNDASPLD